MGRKCSGQIAEINRQACQSGSMITEEHKLPRHTVRATGITNKIAARMSRPITRKMTGHKPSEGSRRYIAINEAQNLAMAKIAGPGRGQKYDAIRVIWV